VVNISYDISKLPISFNHAEFFLSLGSKADVKQLFKDLFEICNVVEYLVHVYHQTAQLCQLGPFRFEGGRKDSTNKVEVEVAVVLVIG